MAFIVFLSIILSSIVALIAYFVRDVRKIEDIVPDFDAEEESEKEKKD
jgi:hypothetical protein